MAAPTCASTGIAMRTLGLRLLALVYLLVSAPCAAAADDAAAWMFDPGVIARIDLVLSADALAALDAEPDEYVPATFTLAYEDRRYGPWTVSLRLKGGIGSFRPLTGKPGFKLKFPAGARPDGLKKLTLNSMVQDGSKVREAVSYELFRAMDVAAPRTGYATVTLNGEPYGLYLNVETLDAVGLSRWYPTTQHLYEGGYGYLTNPLDPFDDHYEVDEGDDDDRADLAGLLATAQDLSPGWYARMAAVADLEQMTRMWATEAYVGHWDGYTGALVSNYYLHADDDGRFTMLPWGTDQTLAIRTPLGDDSPLHVLLNGCVQDPICDALYGDALATVTSVARRARLARRAGAIEREIRAAIAADPRLEHTPADARRVLVATVRFLRVRPADFTAWVATRPRAPRVTTADAGAGAITLRWIKPSSRLRKALSGHAVEHRLVGGPWTRVELSPDTTAHTIIGLPAGTYEIRVRRLVGAAASIEAAASVDAAPLSLTIAP